MFKSEMSQKADIINDADYRKAVLLTLQAHGPPEAHYTIVYDVTTLSYIIICTYTRNNYTQVQKCKIEDWYVWDDNFDEVLQYIVNVAKKFFLTWEQQMLDDLQTELERNNLVDK